MTHTYIVLSRAGAHRDLAKDAREQAFWDEHASFVDGLVEEGFIVMGGPLADEGGAMLVVRGDGEDEVRARFANDPWYEHGILRLESVSRWDIFIDRRS